MTNEHGLAYVDTRDEEIRVLREALLRIYRAYPHDWCGKVAADGINHADKLREKNDAY